MIEDSQIEIIHIVGSVVFNNLNLMYCLLIV